MTRGGTDAGRMDREPEGFQVEFVPVESSAEEVLDQQPGGLLHTPAGRWLAGGLAVAALGGALVVRAATQARPAAPRSATVSVPVRVPSDVIGLYHDMNVPVGPPTLSYPPCADSGRECDVATDLPHPFVDAVRQWLDLESMTEQTDVTVGGRQVVYRQLRGTARGGASVEVSVVGTDSAAGDGWGDTRVGGKTETWVTHPTGTGLLVKVVLTGVSSWTPPQLAMAALAADPRLLLPG